MQIKAASIRRKHAAALFFPKKLIRTKRILRKASKSSTSKKPELLH
jgi:hypothetical protein